MKIFDAHGDILSDVMEKFRVGEDVFEDYHLELYKKGEIEGSVFINFSDPFSEKQDEYFQEVNLVALEYFKKREDIHVVTNSYSSRKFNVLFGIEGLKPVKDLKHVKELVDLGYRLFGLTWNENNQFAHYCESKLGLTKLGEDLVKYADQHNLLIDLAHASEASFYDVLKISKKPLLVSHSGCRALFDHPRNLSDEQLIAIKNSGGVVGIFNIRSFLSEQKLDVSLDTFVDHIEHAVKVAGIDHVCLGMDFCYYLGSSSVSGTKGLDTIGDGQLIINKLRARGYNDVDINKIASKNIKRVIFTTLDIK